MRKMIILCMLVVFTQPALAKLYKCTDADGSIIYTDEPCADGKELKLPPLYTYTPAVVPPSFPKVEGDDKNSASYESLSIIAPENDKQVYSTSGTVTVGYTLTPALKTSKGHQFAIALDGKQLKSKGVTNQIRLQNLDRGTHSVQIFVVDSKNSIIISSQTTTFHLRRESVIQTPVPGSPAKAPQATPAPSAPRAPGTGSGL